MIMLTPAEELGLSGHHIDSRVRRAAARLPPAQLRELAQRVAAAAAQHRMMYVRDGLLEAVRILLCPLVLLPDQQAYLNHVSLTLLGALKRLPDLYLADPAVRAILPFNDEEQAWLGASWTAGHREHNPVFGRLDAVVQFTTPHWKESLHFLEPNLNGVGGIHYAPAVSDIIAELVMPALRAVDPQLVLLPGVDERGLFMQAVLGHLAAIGRPGRRLCLIEPVDADSGPDEQAAMVEYYKRVYELDVLHADPRELSLVGDEVYCRGVLIDLAYRDYSIRDLAALERELGQPLLAMRALFRQNRIISSVAGEFDHKSCWELLTDDELARRHFSAEERQLFARHVLWTRLIRDCRTSLPDGKTGDLGEYVRQQRESLVLKPNCDYGGHGVLLGPACTQAAWEDALALALRAPGQWVVQRLSNLPVHEFPVIAADGAVSFEPFYVVMGLAPTEDGLGILCRASQKQVVNVAQRGGLVAVLLAGAVPPLHSPAAPPPEVLPAAPPRQTPAAALWQELRQRLAELHDLDTALGVLGWDEETYAPEGARPTRGRQTATLESLRQRLLGEPALGDLLASLTAITAADSEEAIVLRRLSHRRAVALRIPEPLVRALASARSLATAAWEHARLDGDYQAMRGPLAQVLQLTRERAAALSSDLPPYDALLDEYETGLRAAPLLALLRQLTTQLAPLRQAIAERPPPDDSFLRRLPFEESAQWQLQLLVVRDLGFDETRGRLDRSSHPFTLACSEHDIRLTTSLSEREPLRGLYSTLHELGHGLYDQGFAPHHYQSGLAEAPSMSVHESQARLWENHVGRSRGFYARYQPVLAALFPRQLTGVTAEQLYRAACLVRPGLSRITADELTYDVHVLWRCELEAALLSGDLGVADLPAAWAERVQRYLGLAVGEPQKVCLQDVHWPQGMFGFFPMYSLGNIYAAALMAAFARSDAAGEAARQRGEYAPLLAWLRRRIHSRGHLLDAPALIAEATGQPVSAAPLVDYLTRKYRELYALA